MSDINIPCPHCGTSFPLTSALAAPLLEAERKKAREVTEEQWSRERAEIEARTRAAVEHEHAEAKRAVQVALAERDDQIAAAKKAELEALKAKDIAEQAKRDIELQVQREVNARRNEIEQAAIERANSAAEERIKVMEAQLTEHEKHVQAAKQAELEAREAKSAADRALRDIDLTVQQRLDAQRAEIERSAAATATASLEARLSDAQTALADKEHKLRQAELAEIEARRLKAEAEDSMRQTELTVARRIDEERNKVRESALRERDDEVRLKVAEKDKQLDDLRRQIEDLRRTGQSASQQLVGEVSEMDLLVILQQAFPGDQFQRVPKGQSGADVLQTVLSPLGAHCGKILWEAKRTKAWQEPWLSKLRADQGAAKAEIAVLATEALPADINTFAERDKVWVTAMRSVVPVAAVLRHGLIEVARTRHFAKVQGSTKDKVLGYLTTPGFKQRVSSIVEGYTDMQTDLDKERRTMKAMWAKREKHMEHIIDGVAGLYGDLHGILGGTLPIVDGLQVEAIGHDDELPPPFATSDSPALYDEEEAM